jgi:uncharacterized protein
MGKLLFWIIVVAAVYFGYRLFLVSQRRTERAARQAASKRERDEQGEPMLRCAHCGVHLPQSEAVVHGGQNFCSIAHRDEAARR